jgi:hypothetical protein
MNCKPGDLAVVVRARFEADTPLVGRVRRVTVLTTPSWTGSPRWLYEGERLTLKNGEVINCLADAALRPIRDPGEDARDESLAWLPPVPNTTKETA